MILAERFHDRACLRVDPVVFGVKLAAKRDDCAGFAGCGWRGVAGCGRGVACGNRGERGAVVACAATAAEIADGLLEEKRGKTEDFHMREYPSSKACAGENDTYPSL